MICARGQNKRRTLKLAGRDAARRFASHRNRKRGSNGWLPLVLQWRQRRSARRNVRTDRVKALAPQLSFLQTHFCFETYASDPHRVRSMPGLFSTISIYRQSMTLARHLINSTSVYSASKNPRNHYRASHSASIRVSLNRERIVFDRNRTHVVTNNGGSLAWRTDRIIERPQLVIERTESLRPSRSAKSITNQILLRPRTSYVAQILRAARMNTRHEQLTHVVKTHTMDDHPRAFSRRSPARETVTFAAPPTKQIAQVKFERPEELVWRRAPAPLVNEISGHSNIAAPAQHQSARAVVEETPGQTTSSSAGRSATRPITKLDPALMDRLTDDVIRRVEQRARIERQRRGL